MFASKSTDPRPCSPRALINGRALARRTLREGSAFHTLLAEVRATQTQHAAAAWRSIRTGTEAPAATCGVDGPFYRDQVRSERVRALPPREALLLFPVIDKEAVRAAGNSLLSTDARRPLIEGTTSGTTGSPLRVKQDLAAVNREHAFVHRQLEWQAPRGGRRAWIRGDLVVDGRAIGRRTGDRMLSRPC